MSAGVADARESVILGADCNIERTVPCPRHKSGRESADSYFNVKALILQHSGNPPGGLYFLKARFRVPVNPVTQVEQSRVYSIQFLCHGVPGIHWRLLGSSSLCSLYYGLKLNRLVPITLLGGLVLEWFLSRESVSFLEWRAGE